jgi:hypothetical protein
MNTDSLIDALVADRGSPQSPPGRALALWLAPAVAVAGLLMLTTLGIRPDIRAAAADWRFPLKILIMTATMASGLWLVWVAAHPTGRPALAALAAAPLLLIGGLAAEVITVPPGDWATRAMGTNALPCLLSIPAFSAVPLAAALVALRGAAPANPTAAGALAGLAAGGIGGAVYGLHCFDDSPLFVAIWYPVGIALMTTAGALIGRRMLRW